MFEDQARTASEAYKEVLKEYQANKPAEASDDEEENAGSSAKAAKGATKARAKKDPNAPKKPESSFMLFLASKREEIKAENPGISVAEVAKKGGELWKTISPENKAVYEAKAAAAKDVYAKAMAEFVVLHKKIVRMVADSQSRYTPSESAAPKTKAPAKPKAATKKVDPKQATLSFKKPLVRACEIFYLVFRALGLKFVGCLQSEEKIESSDSD